MASISIRRGRGGPQVEAMGEPRDLKTAVSPQSIYSFDEKRSDYVERPQWGPNGWDRLASALSKFNPVLNKMAAAHNEQFREEQTAIGRKLMHENKTAWSEFVKAHPEYAGLNPHLERGYKAAELSAKAQDFHAALQGYYTNGGLINQTDPAKVREAVNQFGKSWTAENVSGEYDPEIYAENYLKAVEQSEGAILGRHTSDRADEHIKQAVEKHGQLFATNADAILENTPGISNPQVLSAALDSIADHAMNQMRIMMDTGVPLTAATAIIEDGIINLAKAEGMEGNGEEILALAGRIKTGSGTIGGKPGFRAKEKALREEWDRDRRQNNAEAIQMWHFTKARAREQASTVIGSALMEAYRNRQPIPEATALMSLPGVGGEHLVEVNSIRNSFLGLTTYRPVMDKSAQIEFAVDQHLARTGRFPPEQTFERIGRYGDKALELYDAAAKAYGGTDPVSVALRGDGFRAAETVLETILTGAGGDANDPVKLKERTNEAKEALADLVAIYVDEGEKGHKPRSAQEIRHYAREQAIRLGQDPFYRDQSTTRDMTTQAEREKRATPEYWSTNEKRYFESEEAAGDMLWSFIRSEAQTRTDLQTKYGIPSEMIDNFVVNQARLFKIDLPGMIRQHQEDQRKSQEAQERQKTLWESYTTYPMP